MRKKKKRPGSDWTLAMGRKISRSTYIVSFSGFLSNFILDVNLTRQSYFDNFKD